MNKETFKAILASVLVITMVIAGLFGLALSAADGDKLFAISFGCFVLQIIWSLVMTIIKADKKNEGSE